MTTPALYLHSAGDPGAWSALGISSRRPTADRASESTAREDGAGETPATGDVRAVPRHAPVLPRTPPGLLYLHTKSSHAALALLIRCLARLAALSDSKHEAADAPGGRSAGAPLSVGAGSTLLWDVLGRFKQAFRRRRAQPDGHQWQGDCAKWAAVAGELVLGASPAWTASDDVAAPWGRMLDHWGEPCSSGDDRSDGSTSRGAGVAGGDRVPTWMAVEFVEEWFGEGCVYALETRGEWGGEMGGGERWWGVQMERRGKVDGGT